MEFLPKSLERYSASLRTYLQKRYIRSNNAEFLLRFFKKVQLFEIMTSEQQATPTNLLEFCDDVISCVQMELMKSGRYFSCSLSVNGCFEIDRRIMTVILCNCSKNCSKISIKSKDDELHIIYIGSKPDKITRKLLSNIEAVYLYNSKKRINGINIKIKKTQKTPLPCEKVWLQIIDPLSPVKAYLYD